MTRLPPNPVGWWLRGWDGAVGQISYVVAEDLYLVDWLQPPDDEEEDEPNDVVYRGAIENGGWEVSPTPPGAIG